MKVHDDGKGFDAKGLRPDFGDVSWGLFRMRERAEMVGGSLRIESTTGEGTTLWVEVPRRESEPANRSEPGENPPKTSP
jgi:signal transduction histidine kinase